jgi:ABC-type thiamine transport system substrate-binding protein
MTESIIPLQVVTPHHYSPYLFSFFLSQLFQTTMSTTTITMTQTVTRPVPQKVTGIPAGKVAVKLPNLFQGFLKQTPPLNPYYEEVRSESERWLTR